MDRRGRRHRRLIALALLVYRLLLRVYPDAFQRAWGADMAQVFGDACREAARCRGLRGVLGVWLATLVDWALSLPREHAARIARPRPRPHAAPRPRRRSGPLDPPGLFQAWWRRPWRAALAGPGQVRYTNMTHRDRFERFTERARRVLSFAQEEAQRFNHNYIGTEHLLLGLIREQDGLAAKVLSNLGVELEAVRRAVAFIIGRGDRIVLGEVGLTPRAKKVIELAVDEAHRLDHHYIGTEHLLLGLIREGEGIAAGVLASLGVRLDAVREETLRYLAETHTQDLDAPKRTAAPLSESNPPESPEPSDAPRIDMTGVRDVMHLAHEEAQRFNHAYMGTEHLLLGMLREPRGVAAQVLASLGVELDAARDQVEAIVGRAENFMPGEFGPTPRARTVIQLAVEEARQLKHPVLRSEHLLLGLVREGQGIGADVLQRLGVSLERVREQTLRYLAARDGETVGPTDPGDPGDKPDADDQPDASGGKA
ncbi:MAG TPA: Clp protease N-terminal domain-containing protein [Ktedonobacterales bacterium]|nr:Clp protease N-terminal domain-containing protein [Ktedonobacterales bacterium]